MLSQTKIKRQQAPATPPIWTSEKKTKNPAPKMRQTHGCAAGCTRRNRIAAGTRNKRKYANVLKIMRYRFADPMRGSEKWGDLRMGEKPQPIDSGLGDQNSLANAIPRCVPRMARNIARGGACAAPVRCGCVVRLG